MEDSSDSLSALFKKPDSIHFVQIQSRVSESPAASSSKDNSVLNVSDSGSVLSEIFQKPKKCMVSSTNSVSQDVTPNPANQNIDAEDTVVCKKKKFNFNVLQSTNCSNIFGNTPSSFCESVARLPKRQKKCLKNADTKITSLSVQFSACDTTESSFVLPKKQPAKQSAADQRTSLKALSLFEKSEPSFLSHTFPSAHNLSVTSNGPESSVVLNKRKSTLKGSEKFSTTNLFDSEPSSVCESFIEKRKTKRFRNDSTHQLFSPKDLSECSNVNDGNEVKLTRKASFVNKENMDVNFDNTVSSVSDSIVLKRGGGFLNAFNKTKDCAANASVNIFGHPEGLSDDCESSSESEESEKDPTSNTCEDESSSCREPESTNRSASTFEDESSTSYKEPESTQKSSSFDQQESVANEDNSTQASEADLSVTLCQDQNSVLGGNRSLRKSVSFREGSNILANLSAIEQSKLTIQPTLLELDENQALENSVDNIPPKFDIEVNESSIDKFILTLEMSEQQKSVECSALGKAEENPTQIVDDVLTAVVESVSKNAENPPTLDAQSAKESCKPEDIQKSSVEVSLLTKEDEQIPSEVRVEVQAESIRVEDVEKPTENTKPTESLEEKTNRSSVLQCVDEVNVDSAKSIENIQMSLMEAVSVNTENLQASFVQPSFAEEPLANLEGMSIADATLKNEDTELLASKIETQVDSLRETNAEKSADNMSLCKSMEIEPNRVCLLETRKKRTVSSASLMDVDNGECENRDSSVKEDQIVETEMNASKGANEMEASALPKSIGTRLSENRCSENLLDETVLPNVSPPVKSNILKADVVGGDDPDFLLAVAPDSELSLSDVALSRLSSSMCHSSKINNVANRINDETRVLHSTPFVSSVQNCSATQNDTYTVPDPVVVKDGTRMSQTLSAIFQCPRVFALSQNESDSISTSQESSIADAEKNRTYTVQKTVTDENSVLLTKKKVAFSELPAEDDLHMFSVNSNLLSETVTIERRVTRSSARLSTLSAMLDESVPSQPGNSSRSSRESRTNVPVTCLDEKAEKSTSTPADESLPKDNERDVPEVPKDNELDVPEDLQIEEQIGEEVSVAINKSLTVEKSVSEKSELPELEVAKTSRLSEKSELEKSEVTRESVPEDVSRPMEESEDEEESKEEAESEKEESEEEEESEREESEEESEQEEESEEERESEREEESERMEESEKIESSQSMEVSKPEVEAQVTKQSALEELDKSTEPQVDEELPAAGQSSPQNEEKSHTAVEEVVNETESGNLRDADESSDTSSLFKRPDSVFLTRSRSRNASMSLSSSRRKSVSFAQPDCTRFSMPSGSQTQATDASMSLVRKMCEDKSTVNGGRKMAPPKQAPKKRRKPLLFEFDSDDEEPPADNSISTLPKQPNFPKFHPWCGKQFYSRITEKMRPKYGVKTNVEAVRLAEYVWKSVKQVEACSDADANHEKVEEMKRTLARKQIVVTHYQFYIFCIQNLPPIFHQRALPMGPLFPCKFDLTKSFDPILADS